MSGELVDTNVLIYAHDRSAGRKRRVAGDLLRRLAEERSGVLSIQVLMEFYVSATRKLPRPLTSGAAIGIVEDYGTWPTFTPIAEDIVAAARTAARYGIHFWDAMIVRAAVCLEAAVIWSEDLNPGQSYDGVPVRNPFV